MMHRQRRARIIKITVQISKSKDKRERKSTDEREKKSKDEQTKNRRVERENEAPG